MRHKSADRKSVLSDVDLLIRIGTYLNGIKFHKQKTLNEVVLKDFVCPRINSKWMDESL